MISSCLTFSRINLNAYLREKFEKRAKEKGFIHPSGKVNLPGYFKHLGMEDLLNPVIKIDGDNEAEYKVEKSEKK
jgi:hypothetical protein